MPINPDATGSVGEPSEFSWTSKDSLLYALGVGAGASDPTGFELEFTTENSNGITQAALPTQVVVMGGGRTPGFGDFNPMFLLHAEQRITLHQPLPAEGTAVATGKVGEIYDKGKAALVYLETDVADADGNPMWSTRAGLFISGEGGWGGDRGLCTYGFTGRALLHAACDSDPARFAGMGGRFKSPVMPGEVLEVHIWDQGDEVLFQTRATGDRVVFDGGVLTRH